MIITYIHYSCFLVEMDSCYYLFDYEKGCICYENPAMGIYFIIDPDGYWLEIVSARK